MGWIMGFEEAGPCEAGVKNMPVACFLGRGRIHGQVTHPVGMVAPAHHFIKRTDCHSQCAHWLRNDGWKI